jgi:hypothetical protein
MACTFRSKAGTWKAPVRFCHRGYPASTETPYLINLVESALEPISHPPRREGESWPGIPRTLLSEHSSERRQNDERRRNRSSEEEGPSADAAPVMRPPSDPRFWRGGDAERERAALLVAEWRPPGCGSTRLVNHRSPSEGRPSSPPRACARQLLRRDAVRGANLSDRIRRAHRVSSKRFDPAKGEPRHQPEVPFTERPDPVRISRRGAHPCPECPCGPSGGSLSSSGLFHRPISGQPISGQPHFWGAMRAAALLLP